MAIVKREALSELWLTPYWTSELTETGSFAPTRSMNHPHAYSATVVCKAGHSIHHTSYQLHDQCLDVAFCTDLTCPPVAALNGVPTSLSPSTNVHYYWSMKYMGCVTWHYYTLLQGSSFGAPPISLILAYAVWGRGGGTRHPSQLCYSNNRIILSCLAYA